MYGFGSSGVKGLELFGRRFAVWRYSLFIGGAMRFGSGV